MSDEPLPAGLDHAARDRLQRVLYVACGIGAVVFGLLLISGDSGIVAQRDSLADWYWWSAILVAIVMPASFIIGAPLAPMNRTRPVARLVVFGFLALQFLFVPAMTVAALPLGTAPWLQGINALPSTVAGVTWRTRWVWLFPVMQGPIVATVQVLATDNPPIDAILDGLGAMMFCSILTGIAQAVMGAADQQDRAAARARAQAAIESARLTTERERARIDAIVHDDIMSVLLAASRPEAPAGLPRQAQQALAAVHAIAGPREAAGDYTPAEAVAVLRSTVVDTAPAARVAYATDAVEPVPSAAVAAVAEALAEALRNVTRHAGAGARVEIAIKIDNGSLAVSVRDDGDGFDTRRVSPTRLGLRVSIMDRMQSVPGGSARVSSRVGHGTAVTLEWKRP